MGRGAPNKKGLDYFPKMVDFYEDDKVFDLLEEYGPLGVTVYDVILTIVYANGYYVEMTADKLSRMVIRKIGSKWVPNKKTVVQVIHFCADSGLLDAASLSRGVITSVGIQRRYYRIAVGLMKRQLYNTKYWLLEDKNPALKKDGFQEPVLNAPKSRISSEENRLSSEENRLSSEESPIKGKERKKEYIYTAPPAAGQPFEDQELERAFQLFLVCRKQNGDQFTPERIRALREELLSVGKDNAERIAIANKSAANGWKGFWPSRKGRKEKDGEKQGKGKFNNFPQRKYDYGELEKKLLDC